MLAKIWIITYVILRLNYTLQATESKLKGLFALTSKVIPSYEIFHLWRIPKLYLLGALDDWAQLLVHSLIEIG